MSAGVLIIAPDGMAVYRCMGCGQDYAYKTTAESCYSRHIRYPISHTIGTQGSIGPQGYPGVQGSIGADGPVGIQGSQAGVAQSAEQVPRKNEIVGSTPSSSSKTENQGFSETQRSKMSYIVHHRVNIEDYRKKIREAEVELKEAEVRLSKAKMKVSAERLRYNKLIEETTCNLEDAERDLKLSILEEVTVKGIPDKKEKEEIPAEPSEEVYELGRAD